MSRPDWKALYFEERRVLHELLARLGTSLPRGTAEPRRAVVVGTPKPDDGGMGRLAAVIRAARPELTEAEADAAARDAFVRFTDGGE